jgi:UDPglucose 6-dehydrogenase
LKISIIGAGSVGKATGVGLSQIGHEVIFHDISNKKLRELNAEGFNTTENLHEIQDSDVHMICVPTPVSDNCMDLSIIETILKELGKLIVASNKYQVVVIRSTILPLTFQNRLIPLLRYHCQLEYGKNYGACYNPELLREAYALDDFLKPPIIIIGTKDKKSAEIMKQLYAPIKAPVLVTTPENAEAIKLFSNIFNATKISFFNELFTICKKLGLNHQVISKALTLSSLGVRIPEYYTEGGYPFGGKCLPKDLIATITLLKENNLSPALFQAVYEINEAMKRPGT